MTEKRPSIAVILPAYNEANRIPLVLDVLAQTDFVDEILVVDDGSSDGTAERVRRAAEADPRLRLLQHTENLGKGQAIFTARAATRAPYLILLDADLVGLKPEHLRALIQPVIERRADMTLGLFRGGRLHTDFSHWLTPWLSGQRGLRAEVLDAVPPQAAAGYGFETALTLAASRCGYRTQAVFLRGVWHTPSEFHRRRGFRWRLRMYAHILRAWRQSGGWQTLWSHLRKRTLPLTLLLLTLFFVLAYHRGRAASLSSAVSELNELPSLTLTETQNVMLFAPHPDDETLAAGGVIQAALEQGARVNIVIVTNGDGQRFAPAVLEKRLRAGPQDYVRLGQARQAESRAALRELGLNEENILFLGYPDRGLAPLWLADWKTQCPFTAPYTRASAPPYENTFDPHAEYCGDALLRDLTLLLETDRPDLILLPHPADQHPDHRALSAFVRLAIALEQQKHPDYRPRLWGYLVHYGAFPQPRGHLPQQALVPPERLEDETWGRFDLSPAQVDRKARAIQRYPSQVLLLRNFLPSFARRDELFVTLSLPALSSLDYRDLTLPAATIAEPGDPDQAALTRLTDLPVRGNAIEGWQIGRLGDAILLKVQARRELLPVGQLLLRIKLPDGGTRSFVLAPAGPLFGPADYLTQLDLAELGHPEALGISAELREGSVIISESGWHILTLPSAP
jgi:LmbE family N-acetylglucosaminyl deacetylase